ncbi:hypothetical protein [Neolewinella agarilytica]|uniref:hypothetical protein n=1 Tax=Neolewinella agarilytica TaxID=478744 RepID=UPI002352570D|nr:hypothetical protein [Neolewinella agarilytica]
MRYSPFHTTLLLLAGLLLSLHSVVPHVHGLPCGKPGEVTAGHIPASGGDLLGLLQDFFTNTDLGEDHLEHFSADHDVTLDLAFTATLPPATLPHIVLAVISEPGVTRRERVFRSWHFPPSGVYPDADAPRGPPTIV